MSEQVKGLEDWLNEERADKDREIKRLRMALDKCHEELVGHLMHEGGDLKRALEMADEALSTGNGSKED